ncbi:MAG TPA: hypothetical protein VKB76_03090, partial [Ktedonobacterales bacterium]|nr:hypothetical protein [Ktedonobacterales bacterium]
MSPLTRVSLWRLFQAEDEQRFGIKRFHGTDPRGDRLDTPGWPPRRLRHLAHRTARATCVTGMVCVGGVGNATHSRPVTVAISARSGDYSFNDR